jgi:hypothetical protein
MWVNLKPEEVAAIAELDSLPDRAAGIVGATILESRLGDRLKRETPSFVIKEKNTLHQRMFNYRGPLGSFSARIDLGFMLKIYDEQAWRDLDVIRDIRNSFAHATEIGSFNTASVRNRCENLKVCDSAAHFCEFKSDDGVLISTAESANFTEMMLHVPDLDARRADPRQRYLLCVKYYAAYLMHPFGTLTVHP